MHTSGWLLPTLALAVTTTLFSGCASAQPPHAGRGPSAPAGTQAAPANTSPTGYYRTPAIAGGTLLFCAEGDIWSAPLAGGRASRLTSHPGEETLPVVSPDGTTIAFAAQYEGPQEVYTMPIAGGLPVRRTYYGGRSVPVAWGSLGDTTDANSRLVVATRRYSTLPDTQLVVIDTADSDVHELPLAQAAEAGFDDRGDLFFTRPDFQGSHTRRYVGGTAQKIWRLNAPPAPDAQVKEATVLTADYDGTSASPMWFNGRVYFRSDRSGVMNIWSMTPDGKDARPETTHDDYEVKTPSLGVGPDGSGHIAYQHGADIWVLDLATGKTSPVPLRLESDLDQTREKWIDKPMGMVTAAHVSADGERVAITARGQVFVAPRKYGRLVEAERHPGVRYRDARFMPGDDGERLLTLSDESGEVEMWTLPANGVGEAAQLSTGADVLRWEAVPSPDGKLIAHHDKNQKLWVLDVATKTSKQIDENPVDAFTDLRWSPDSRYLAYASWAPNLNQIVKLYDSRSGSVTQLTTDRTSSFSPAWAPKGDFLYFLSERNLKSLVGSPWGTLQPEPFFDKRMKVYGLALRPGLRSPFEEPNELTRKAEEDKKHGADKADKADKAASKSAADGEKDSPKKDGDKTPPSPAPIEIELTGIADRVYETPVPAGNYRALSVNDKAFFFAAYEASADRDAKAELRAFAIDADALKKREWKIETVAAGVEDYELSQDGKSLLIRTANSIAIVDAAPAKADDLGKKAVDLSGWKLTIEPREEWRQMYNEAWRLHRDYFYDRNMNGVDWVAMKAKYAPLADRVACRSDLSDVLGQLIAELSALHQFVVGGDMRKGPEHVAVATLGADLVRDEAAGGYRIREVYLSDPDRPDLLSPLARPGLDIRAGDVVTMIDGQKTLAAAGVSEMLRNKAGRQVLIDTVRNGGAPTPSIVVPIDMGTDTELRYRQWELQRRAMVEEQGKGDIGYIHLRTMGTSDMADFARQYYPLFMRKGLVIDVRHNGGGNIDSWVLSRLMRKAWFYWQGRVGEQTWNMPYAFRGHMVVLCDEKTGSDGEAFSEGFRRLGLGKVIGTRTWGGEIWLSFSNYLVDKGIASAAEIGVYGPEGTWLIEGRGVEPDIVVDNPPVATFRGGDAQLEAAIHTLQQQIKEHPVEVPPVPKYPDKSWNK